MATRRFGSANVRYKSLKKDRNKEKEKKKSVVSANMVLCTALNVYLPTRMLNSS